MNSISKNRIARWVLLAAGLVAIIALTGMNVYSLYTLRNTMVDTDRERKNLQLEEVVSKIRQSMYEPFWGLGRINLSTVEAQFEQNRQFPDNFKEVIEKAANSGFYSEVYYTPENTDPCGNSRVFSYDNENDKFDPTRDYNDLICDGVGVARTRARIALDDIEYRWNTSVQFDTHRSMNIALIDINGDRNIIGFLTFIIDQDYLVNDYIQPLLVETFGDENKSGVAVWLHNWVQDEVLATNASSIDYDVDLVDYRQVFPNFFQNWNIKIQYNTTEAAVAYNDSLTKNLLVLGAAVSLLIGAMFFMFNTAQKERKLAMRQAGFLANVTHELKTPLAVMQAAGENIADGRVKDEDRLKKYGDHIYNEAIRLRKMIESLLDVAKADAGESFVQQVPVEINQFTLEFVENNRPYLEQKGFEVETSIPDSLPQIYADADSLETILNNLTENAIKYSPDTKYVGYFLEQVKDEIVLKVQDKGMGIPKKAQRHIFDKFYRVEDSLTASTKGHGLGLSIVKNYVDLNGAGIEVESETGKGTTFIIKFPALDESNLASLKDMDKRHQSNTETENMEYVG